MTALTWDPCPECKGRKAHRQDGSGDIGGEESEREKRVKKFNPKAYLKPPDKKPEEVYEEERWRSQAKAVVAAVLERCEGKPDKELLKALREAYPFGSRKPARIWRSEVGRQRKLRKRFNDPRQVKLFEDV